MDPESTARVILENIARGAAGCDLDVISAASADLRSWIARGGFPPFGWGVVHAIGLCDAADRYVRTSD